MAGREGGFERTRYGGDNRAKGGQRGTRNKFARPSIVPSALAGKDVSSRSSEGSGLVSLGKQALQRHVAPPFQEQPTAPQVKIGTAKPAWGGVRPAVAVPAPDQTAARSEFPGLGEAPPSPLPSSEQQPIKAGASTAEATSVNSGEHALQMQDSHPPGTRSPTQEGRQQPRGPSGLGQQDRSLRKNTGRNNRNGRNRQRDREQKGRSDTTESWRPVERQKAEISQGHHIENEQTSTEPPRQAEHGSTAPPQETGALPNSHVHGRRMGTVINTPHPGSHQRHGAPVTKLDADVQTPGSVMMPQTPEVEEVNFKHVSTPVHVANGPTSPGSFDQPKVEGAKAFQKAPAEPNRSDNGSVHTHWVRNGVPAMPFQPSLLPAGDFRPQPPRSQGQRPERVPSHLMGHPAPEFSQFPPARPQPPLQNFPRVNAPAWQNGQQWVPPLPPPDWKLPPNVQLAQGEPGTALHASYSGASDWQHQQDQPRAPLGHSRGPPRDASSDLQQHRVLNGVWQTPPSSNRLATTHPHAAQNLQFGQMRQNFVQPPAQVPQTQWGHPHQGSKAAGLRMPQATAPQAVEPAAAAHAPGSPGHHRPPPLPSVSLRQATSECSVAGVPEICGTSKTLAVESAKVTPHAGKSQQPTSLQRPSEDPGILAHHAGSNGSLSGKVPRQRPPAVSPEMPQHMPIAASSGVAQQVRLPSQQAASPAEPAAAPHGTAPSEQQAQGRQQEAKAEQVSQGGMVEKGQQGAEHAPEHRHGIPVASRQPGTHHPARQEAEGIRQPPPVESETPPRGSAWGAKKSFKDVVANGGPASSAPARFQTQEPSKPLPSALHNREATKDISRHRQQQHPLPTSESKQPQRAVKQGRAVDQVQSSRAEVNSVKPQSGENSRSLRRGSCQQTGRDQPEQGKSGSPRQDCRPIKQLAPQSPPQQSNPVGDSSASMRPRGTPSVYLTPTQQEPELARPLSEGFQPRKSKSPKRRSRGKSRTVAAGSPSREPTIDDAQPQETEARKAEATTALPADEAIPAVPTVEPAQTEAPERQPPEASSEARSEKMKETLEEFPVKGISKEVGGALRRLVQEYGQTLLASHLRLQPRGLVNTGNLCFMNSILQALMASGPFCQFLQTLRSAEPALSRQQVPVLHAFSHLAASFEAAETQSTDPQKAAGSASSPKRASVDHTSVQQPGKSTPQVLAVLGGKALLPEMMFPTVNRFNPRNVPLNPALAQPISMVERVKGTRVAQREQEDAQEFLGFLLDALHEELISLKNAYAENLNLEVCSNLPAENDGGGWLKQKKGNKKAIAQETGMKGTGTLIEDLCRGQYVSQVKASGRVQRDTTQAFTLLTLDVLPESVKSISDAISRFTDPNNLEGYKLEKDGPQVQATQRMMFLTLPKLLIVHLGRFAYDMSTGNSKVHKVVHFDEKLAIRPNWLADGSHQKRQGNLPKYGLIATVTHLGVTAASGHYVANVKQPSGKWLRFDDAVVTAVALHKVLEEPAYLLIYQQGA